MVVRAPRRPLRRVRIAHAFAPGHVTGIFSPAAQARDPRARGSLGAGVVLDRGVWAEATFRPGRSRPLRLVSDVAGPLPISLEVARRMLGPLRGSLVVRLRHDLPVGQGFGMSAAGALATALAVGRATGATRQRAIEVAHLADLFGGGGLGGVSAILAGGWERRVRPGVPPYGRAVHRPFPLRLWIALLGPPLRSPGLLRDPRFLARVRASAEAGLHLVERHPSVTVFLKASERFGDRLGLAPPPVRRAIRRLRSVGASASQTMFGRSVWAVARRPGVRMRLIRMLESLGYPAVELSAARRGPWSAPGPLREEQAF